MTMKRDRIKLIGALLLGCLTSGAHGINATSTRAMGLAQSYTALARGPESVFWNPANLGLNGGTGFSWDILNYGFTLIAENNSFSVQDYNDNFTSTTHVIGDAEKDKLLGSIDAEGLKFNTDHELAVALGIPINGGGAVPRPERAWWGGILLRSGRDCGQRFSDGYR